MPITATIDRDRKLITEHWTGEVRAKDLEDFWKRHLGDPEVLAIGRNIADLRQSTLLFTGAQMNELIMRVVVPALDGRTWTTAIVVDKQVQHGTSRQYQVFAESFSKDSIFFSIEDANAWLEGQLTGPSSEKTDQ